MAYDRNLNYSSIITTTFKLLTSLLLLASFINDYATNDCIFRENKTTILYTVIMVVTILLIMLMFFQLIYFITQSCVNDESASITHLMIFWLQMVGFAMLISLGIYFYLYSSCTHFNAIKTSFTLIMIVQSILLLTTLIQFGLFTKLYYDHYERIRYASII